MERGRERERERERDNSVWFLNLGDISMNTTNACWAGEC
jgi:hypothetical protein